MTAPLLWAAAALLLIFSAWCFSRWIAGMATARRRDDEERISLDQALRGDRYSAEVIELFGRKRP